MCGSRQNAGATMQHQKINQNKQQPIRNQKLLLLRARFCQPRHAFWHDGDHVWEADDKVPQPAVLWWVIVILKAQPFKHINHINILYVSICCPLFSHCALLSDLFPLSSVNVSLSVCTKSAPGTFL